MSTWLEIWGDGTFSARSVLILVLDTTDTWQQVNHVIFWQVGRNIIKLVYKVKQNALKIISMLIFVTMVPATEQALNK